MQINLYRETYTFKPADLARLNAMEAELTPLVELCGRGAPVRIERDASLHARYPVGRAVLDIYVQDEELSGFMLQLLRRVGYSAMRFEAVADKDESRQWVLSVLLLPPPENERTDSQTP